MALPTLLLSRFIARQLSVLFLANIDITREGWRSLIASTEGRVESIKRAVFFLRMILPWRGNDWVVGYSMVRWLPEGAMLFSGGNATREKYGDFIPET